MRLKVSVRERNEPDLNEGNVTPENKEATRETACSHRVRASRSVALRSCADRFKGSQNFLPSAGTRDRSFKIIAKI